jgi:hypothetical protein
MLDFRFITSLEAHSDISFFLFSLRLSLLTLLSLHALLDLFFIFLNNLRVELKLSLLSDIDDIFSLGLDLAKNDKFLEVSQHLEVIVDDRLSVSS